MLIRVLGELTLKFHQKKRKRKKMPGNVLHCKLNYSFLIFTLVCGT